MFPGREVMAGGVRLTTTAAAMMVTVAVLLLLVSDAGALLVLWGGKGYAEMNG